MKKYFSKKFFMLLVISMMALSGCGSSESAETSVETNVETQETESTEEETAEEDISKRELNNIQKTIDISAIPKFNGDAYVIINDNIPLFEESEISTDPYESYAELDALGRCGECIANIGNDIMSTEERGKIGSVKPTGWKQNKYPGLVDGNYIYNRCHLIGYQLSAENANPNNLITGTKYLNTEGMLPFENMVADYIKETNNHVLYRATPIFVEDDLLATGVLLEAKSVEDAGEGIEFCVFCYNVQPGIVIDYKNGDNWLDDSENSINETDVNKDNEVSGGNEVIDATPKAETMNSSDQNNERMVWIPASGKKYHSKSSCSNMNNPSEVTESQANSLGYTPCKKCW